MGLDAPLKAPLHFGASPSVDAAPTAGDSTCALEFSISFFDFILNVSFLI